MPSPGYFALGREKKKERENKRKKFLYNKRIRFCFEYLEYNDNDDNIELLHDITILCCQ